jgi:hypothetical protein
MERCEQNSCGIMPYHSPKQRVEYRISLAVSMDTNTIRCTECGGVVADLSECRRWGLKTPEIDLLEARLARENLIVVLNQYFSTLDDFQEWDESRTADLADYILREVK